MLINTEVGINNTQRPKTLLSPPIGNKKYEDVKLMHKPLTQHSCSKHLQHITIEKNIFSELNRCIFQIS